MKIFSNKLTELPPWLASLPKLKVLDAYNNPLQMPPASTCLKGIEAVRVSFDRGKDQNLGAAVGAINGQKSYETHMFFV